MTAFKLPKRQRAALIRKAYSYQAKNGSENLAGYIAGLIPFITANGTDEEINNYAAGIAYLAKPQSGAL